MALMRFGRILVDKRLILAVGFAAIAAAPRIARADIIYDVAYTTTLAEGCSISCIDFPPGLFETATFTLPDADLLTPGTYDVSATYSNPGINAATTPTAIADAIVLGGVVTDLTVNLNGTFPAPPLGTASQDLSASGGGFTQGTSFNGGSSFYRGTYVITVEGETVDPTPEPGTALLLGVGLLAGVAIPKFLRRRHAAGTSAQA